MNVSGSYGRIAALASLLLAVFSSGCRFDSECASVDPECSLVGALLYAGADLCALSHFEVIQPRHRSRFFGELRRVAALGSIRSPSASTFGTVPGATTQWPSGVLAPDGRIFGLPFSTDNYLVMQPADNTLSTFGSASALGGKWTGGVLAPNGKLYGIPTAATEVLLIDPNTQEVRTFGSLSSGSSKWIGGVLAPNGKIYGIPAGPLGSPQDAPDFLVIDPNSETVSTFAGPTGSGGWRGGVLGPNGKIYGIPTEATNILVIDPDTNTATTLPSPTGAGGWRGGVVAPDGKIYGIPSTTNTLLVIDPQTGSTSTIAAATGYTEAVLGANGKIYLVPTAAATTQVLEFDPQTGSMTTFGGPFAVNLKWEGGILVSDGRIFANIARETRGLIIDPGSTGTLCPSIVQSAYLNKM